MAAWMGISTRSLDRFADEGMPVARRGKGRKPGGYDPKECFGWYLERERASLMGGDEVSPQKARALLDVRRREELELKLKVRRGELLPIEQVSRELQDIAATVKARLRRIPTAMADRLIGLNDPHEIKARLLTEIDAALLELSAKAEAAGTTESSAA